MKNEKKQQINANNVAITSQINKRKEMKNLVH